MATFEQGDVFAGLTVVRPLGAGGMGEMYLVEHPGLRRREALKIIRAATDDPQLMHRFVNEARVVAALDHPSIITIYGFGVEEGSPWFTMQYLEAVDLTEVGPQRPDVVGRIVGDAASALDYAHSRGVLHRDIKPANIATVLGPQGEVQRVVVLDFGIARMADSTRLTAQGAFLGSVAYAAPETLQNGTWDERADQYGLACTAYELLTGSQAFRADTVGELVRKHVLGDVPRPSAVDPALAPHDGVFARALAKNPADRFATCSEFAAAFAAVSGGRGATVVQSSAPQLAPSSRAGGSGWTRPRNLAFGVLGVALLLGAVVLSAFLLTPGDDDGTTQAADAAATDQPVSTGSGSGANCVEDFKLILKLESPTVDGSYGQGNEVDGALRYSLSVYNWGDIDCTIPVADIALDVGGEGNDICHPDTGDLTLRAGDQKLLDSYEEAWGTCVSSSVDSPGEYTLQAIISHDGVAAMSNKVSFLSEVSGVNTPR